jgi:hypothetical protein
VTLNQGAEKPTCQFCGAGLVFRGQTSCQSCGRDLTGRSDTPALPPSVPAGQEAVSATPPFPATPATTVPAPAPATHEIPPAPPPAASTRFFQSFALPPATPMPPTPILSDATAPAASKTPSLRTVTPADAAATARGALAGEAPTSTIAQPAGPQPASPPPVAAPPGFVRPDTSQRKDPRWSGSSHRPPPPTRGAPPSPPAGWPPSPGSNPYWSEQRSQWLARRSSPRRSGLGCGTWLFIGIIVVFGLSAIGHSGGGQISYAAETPYGLVDPYQAGDPNQALPVMPFEGGPAAGVTFPLSDPLAAVGPLSQARTDHTATLLPDGRVVVAGGVDVIGSSGAAVDTIETYDPRSRSFTTSGRLLTARSKHTASLLADGTVLFAGGLDSSGNPLASAEVFDPTTGLSRGTGALPEPRSSASAVGLDDGRVLIVGGYGANEMAWNAVVYDPAVGQFQPAPTDMGAGLVTAIKLNDGRVLVAGGLLSGTSLNLAQVFDPMTDQFANVSSMSQARGAATSCLLATGQVLVVGGTDGSGSPIAWAEIFDPAADAFFKHVQLDDYRSQGTTTALADGSVLMVGGLGAGGVPNATIERFDPSTGISTPLGTMTAARSGHTATRLEDGSVLIVAGAVSPWRVTDQAYIYDPTRVQDPSAASPSAIDTPSPGASDSSGPEAVSSGTPPPSP